MSTRFDPLLPTFSRKENCREKYFIYLFYENPYKLTLEVVTLVPVRENEGKVTKGKEKQAGNIIINISSPILCTEQICNCTSIT